MAHAFHSPWNQERLLFWHSSCIWVTFRSAQIFIRSGWRKCQFPSYYSNGQTHVCSFVFSLLSCRHCFHGCKSLQSWGPLQDDIYQRRRLSRRQVTKTLTNAQHGTITGLICSMGLSIKPGHLECTQWCNHTNLFFSLSTYSAYIYLISEPDQSAFVPVCYLACSHVLHRRLEFSLRVYFQHLVLYPHHSHRRRRVVMCSYVHLACVWSDCV